MKLDFSVNVCSNNLLKGLITPTAVEKQMLDNLRVDESMRLASPAPIKRFPREKIKLNNDGDVNVIRSSYHNKK